LHVFKAYILHVFAAWGLWSEQIAQIARAGLERRPKAGAEPSPERSAQFVQSKVPKPTKYMQLRLKTCKNEENWLPAQFDMSPFGGLTGGYLSFVSMNSTITATGNAH
jgi:hypothetical protein